MDVEYLNACSGASGKRGATGPTGDTGLPGRVINDVDTGAECEGPSGKENTFISHADCEGPAGK